MQERKLDQSIVAFLAEKTGKKASTVKKDIYTLKMSKYPSLPVNAIAHLYALKSGTSVLRKLTRAEKSSLPNLEVQKPIVVSRNPPSKKGASQRIVEFVKYDSDDVFVRAHIDEINRAYTFAFYTSALMLCRKLIENLLVGILRQKYPKQFDLYYDSARGKMRDLSEIVSTLRNKAAEFGPEKRLLEHILGEVEKLKGDMNDKVHSLFNIVKNRKELDDLNLQYVFEMIARLERLEAQKLAASGSQP